MSPPSIEPLALPTASLPLVYPNKGWVNDVPI